MRVLCFAFGWLLAAAAYAQTEAHERLFLVHLTLGPAWRAEVPANAQPGFGEHSANLARLRGSGRLLVGARYADKGMLVVRAADRAAVEREFAADPMVANGAFALQIDELAPFYEGYVPRAQPRPAAAEGIDRFAWLAGCWLGAGGRREHREHWMRPGGGTMLGMARTLVDGKPRTHETMMLREDPNLGWIYWAHPSGQKEASFAIRSADASGFVAENPAHDFPQRVLYRRVGPDELLARIEGTVDGRPRGVDFPLKRTACD